MIDDCFSLVPSTMSNRLKQIVGDQIKTRDSGSVQCEDLLQTIMNGRDKYGTISEISCCSNGSYKFT